MPPFRFFHPIEIRYGDLDPQGHVNNAAQVTYLEQARIQYLIALGLFDQARSFMDVGIILAETRITYKAPVEWGMPVQVGVRVTRLGTKSMEMEYVLSDRETGRELSTGSTVLVAYDYRTRQSIPIPDAWREKIRTFEEIP